MEANPPSAKESQWAGSTRNCDHQLNGLSIARQVSYEQPEQLSIVICGLTYQTHIKVSGTSLELPEYPSNTIRDALPEDADDGAMTSIVWASERTLLDSNDPLALDFDFALLFPGIQNFRNQKKAFRKLQIIYRTPSLGPLALRCATASAAFVAICDQGGDAYWRFPLPSEKRNSDSIVNHRDSKRPRIDDFIPRDLLEKAADGNSRDYNHSSETGGLTTFADSDKTRHQIQVSELTLGNEKSVICAEQGGPITCEPDDSSNLSSLSSLETLQNHHDEDAVMTEYNDQPIDFFAEEPDKFVNTSDEQLVEKERVTEKSRTSTVKLAGDRSQHLDTNELPDIPISHQGGGPDLTFALLMDFEQKNNMKKNAGSEDQRHLEKQGCSVEESHRRAETYIKPVDQGLALATINTREAVAWEASDPVIDSQERDSEYKSYQTETSSVEPALEQISENFQDPDNEEGQRYGPFSTPKTLESKHTEDNCSTRRHESNYSDENTQKYTCSTFRIIPSQISPSSETTSDKLHDPPIWDDENSFTKSTGHPNSRNVLYVNIPYIQQGKVKSGNDKKAKAQQASTTQFQHSSRIGKLPSLEVMTQPGLPQRPPQILKETVGSLSLQVASSSLPPRPPTLS